MKLFKNAAAKTEAVKTALYGATTAVMLSPAFAFAADGDFDASEIIAKTVTYTAIAVSILGAFALGRWTLKAMGLIGGKS